jgi:hypothetical protein
MKCTTFPTEETLIVSNFDSAARTTDIPCAIRSGYSDLFDRKELNPATPKPIRYGNRVLGFYWGLVAD